MATSSTNLITALGAGSGVDVKALAQSLVDAEKKPRADLINNKIAKSEARISGYGALNFVVSELRSKFAALDDLGDLNSLTVSNSQTSAFTAVASSKAIAGTHSVEVLSLAAAQRRASEGFASATSQLNGGQAFNLSLTVGNGSATTIPVSAVQSTPTGVVNAINAANLGVSAQLVNTGDANTPFTIVLTGQTGTANAFTLSSDIAAGQTGIDFSRSLQSASNASLRVNGLSITRSSNLIEDALPGVQLKLSALTAGPAALGVTRDTSSLQTKLSDLVKAYNDFDAILNVTADPKSEVEGYGASLVGDSLVSSLRAQVRSIFTGDSSTPGTQIKALRDLGISITSEGKMALNSAKLSDALAKNYDDAVKMLSDNRETPTMLMSWNSGLAGDAVKKLQAIISSTGTLATQSRNSQAEIAKFKTDLTSLDMRMTKLLDRYQQQFGAMEALVGQTNSLKSSLKSSFEAMSAQYGK